MFRSYVILGAQKSGTTSLYELICQHSLSVKGKRRESHYFDWYWKENGTTSGGKEYYEQHYRNYASFYPIDSLNRHPSLFTGESTPSYLLHR
jgi:hypothetical protein